MNNMIDTAKQIDDIMFELEEQGLLPKLTSKFNFIDEIRHHFGDEKFLDILRDIIWTNNIKIESK